MQSHATPRQLIAVDRNDQMIQRRQIQQATAAFVWCAHLGNTAATFEGEFAEHNLLVAQHQRTQGGRDGLVVAF